MSLKLGLLGAGLMAAAAGAEDARATIDDLQAQGYDVQINWVSGIPMVPLYRCKVTGINNPNHSPPSENTFATVYVDVSCPNPDDDWGRGRYRSRCRFLTATQILVNVKMTGFE